MKHRKTQLAAAVGVALLAGAGAVQAQNLTVQLYGQVNRALMFADDEVRSKVFHVDGQPSSTRFGIMGSSQIAPGLRAGARIESEMKSNPSNVVTFGNPSAGAVSPASGTDLVLFAERWLDASLEGAWGRLNMGQGSGAADDASTIDLSGTAIANGLCVCDWGGAISHINSATGAAVATVSGTQDNLDFESRYDRFMYTTPVFGGFRVQAGFGQRDDSGEAKEISLWYSAKIAGEIQAAIGYSTVNLFPVDRETIGGSISWLHTSGLNLTFAYTQREVSSPTALNPLASRDANHMSAKIGYKFGQHAIAFNYIQAEDQGASGDEAKSYSVGYVWNPIRWAEIYANYILYTLDRTGLSLNDIKVGAVGTRIRF